MVIRFYQNQKYDYEFEEKQDIYNIIVKNLKEAYKNNVLDASHGCKDPRASVNGACREKFKFANCAKDCKIFSRE